MKKVIQLILILFTLASFNVIDGTVDKIKDNTTIEEHIEESEKVFEYVNGINIVDSSYNYVEDDKIICQTVYYTDGRVAIYTSDFNICDLIIRDQYIRFKNQFDESLKTYYLDLVYQNYANSKNVLKCPEIASEWLYFNDFLNSNSIPGLPFFYFQKTIKKKSYERAIIQEKVSYTLTLSIIIASVSMLAIAGIKIYYYWKENDKLPEDTS
jgi:hypothetical protein